MGAFGCSVASMRYVNNIFFSSVSVSVVSTQYDADAGRHAYRACSHQAPPPKPADSLQGGAGAGW